MANINKIRVSGTTYDIQDINAPKVIELTQSEYDSLTTKDPNAFYVITDSEYNFDGYWTSAQTQSAITQSVSGKADTSAVTSVSDSLTAHTANTTVHVTAQDKTNWNAKSDFSGNYNDLSNKPTIPTSASQLTNDSGYITSSALDDYTTTATTSALNNVVTAHTANTSIHVSAEQIAAWNAKSDFSGSYNDLTNKLSAGTNISIVDNVISAEGGGGKAVTAGTNISITTGETADTINCTLPITKNSYNNGVTLGWNGDNSLNYFAVAEGYNSKAYGGSSHAEGYTTTAKTQGSHSEGYKTIAGSTIAGYDQEYCHSEGYETTALTYFSHSEGYRNKVQGQASHIEGANNEIINPFGNYTQYRLVGSHAEGKNNKTYNEAEHASGIFNNSVSASTTFGDSGNTLFSVGNGTADNARHNAFEIRQNGDIYLTKDGQDVKLQDQLGGGGSSYTAGDGIDITNDVISVTGKVDTSTYNTYTAATDTALASKQTTLTAGTGISIVDNVISAEGGGKAVAAGTNISVTTGTTADTISCKIPYSDVVYAKSDIILGKDMPSVSDYERVYLGKRIAARSNGSFSYSIGIGVPPSTNSSDYNELYGTQSIGIGGFKIGNGSQYANFVSGCVAIGYGAKTRINDAVAIGKNTEASGTTKTNINNQLTIDTSNQVYIYNKDNTEMICLQDQLGGGGSSYTAGDGIDITSDVISVTGKADTSAVTEVSDALTAHTADTTIHVTSSDKTSWNGAATNASNAVTALGGLSLVKLTQAEYDALATKDNSTLYVIVN